MQKTNRNNLTFFPSFLHWPEQTQTWNLAVFKDELTRVGASHSQFIQLLCRTETRHSLQGTKLNSVNTQRLSVKGLLLMGVGFLQGLAVIQLEVERVQSDMCISNLFDNKCGDSTCSCIYVCLRIHNENVCIRSIRNPEFITVQHVVVTLKGTAYQSKREGKHERAHHAYKCKRGLFQSYTDETFLKHVYGQTRSAMSTTNLYPDYMTITCSKE